jgi:transcriptional regulator with XRE-family HTH domain
MGEESVAEGPGVIEQLREAIRRDGRSLNKLAQASGVGDDQLSRFMGGKRSLTLPAVEKICRALRLGLLPLDPPTDRPAAPVTSPPAEPAVTEGKRRKRPG